MNKTIWMMVPVTILVLTGAGCSTGMYSISSPSKVDHVVFKADEKYTKSPLTRDDNIDWQAYSDQSYPSNGITFKYIGNSLNTTAEKEINEAQKNNGSFEIASALTKDGYGCNTTLDFSFKGYATTSARMEKYTQSEGFKTADKIVPGFENMLDDPYIGEYPVILAAWSLRLGKKEVDITLKGFTDCLKTPEQETLAHQYFQSVLESFRWVSVL